jgi:hypothetical protein
MADLFATALTIGRDIGQTVSNLTKPDGSPISLDSVTSTITKGVVSTAQDLLDQRQQQTALDSATITTLAGNSMPIQRGIPNLLEGFASYTPLFTLVSLKPEEVNNPYLYRSSMYADNQVIFSSAGRYDKERVRTAYGQPEYFINNFHMTSVITGTDKTGATNAISFEFDIFEPYSMGLFLQSLQAGAIAAGYPNYLNSAIYMLKIEFLGYDDSGNTFTGPQPKFFLMTLKKTSFSVTEGGSTYKFSTIPHNHDGFSSVKNQLYTDVSLSGAKVDEVLVYGERSLTVALNEREKKLVEAGVEKSVPDVYEIHFPETANTPIPGLNPGDAEARATVNSGNATVIKSSSGTGDADFGQNSIGSSSFNFSADSGGNYVAPKASQAYDSKTGKVDKDKITASATDRTFQYSQGSSLVQVISQIIIESQYAKDAIKDENIDADGKVAWFRIDVQIQLLDWDKKRNDYAKRIIYRVMPYKVHSAKFVNPGSVPTGYDSLEGKIIKQYNYIYTGQNNDLLKFDIQINNAFFTAISPAAPTASGKISNQDQKGTGQEQVEVYVVDEGPDGAQAATGALGGRSIKSDPAAIKLPFGGSGNLTPEQLIANNFHKAFLDTQADMIKIEAEILGDPFWLVDSGIGGYIAPANAFNEQVTDDNSANYEAGDMYVYIRFRTPIDIKEGTGDYYFFDKSDSPFSGIYQVIKVESKFSDGAFKQNLSCVRMPLQPKDFDGKITPSKTSSFMYKDKGALKPSTSPIDADVSIDPSDPEGYNGPDGESVGT